MSKGRIIQSVARALSILELFESSSTELSVTEIANRLDLSMSTAFGLISTLNHKGYLEQNPRDSRYSLGLKLLRLGGLVRKHSILCRKARPFLEQLVNEFSETVHLAVEKNGLVVYIEKIRGDKAIFMQSDVGAENPMYCTGVGKCLLAYMPEERRERILRNMGPLERRGPNTITNLEDLRTELASIRTQGYCFDDEEYAPGLICVAAPVRSVGGGVVASVSLSGAKAGIPSRKLTKVTARLVEVADKIGDQL